ncbi:MAG: TylF/MycF/NovP-related O-methyltransferase [Phycisphaerales bacterium]
MPATAAVDLDQLLDAADEETLERLFRRALGRSDRLRRLARAQFHDASEVETRRFDRRHLEGALRWAQARCPGAPVYLVSDVGTPELPGVRRVASVESVPRREAPVAFICAFQQDEALLDALRAVRAIPGARYFLPEAYYPCNRWLHRSTHARDALRSAAAMALPRFRVAQFENLLMAIEMVRPVAGLHIEVGVLQGRSAHLAMDYMARAGVEREAWFLDTFEGFAYEEARDSPDGLWADTHLEANEEEVRALLAPFPRAQVLRSNILRDDLPGGDAPIALCNIDVDMHEAVLACAQKAAHRIPAGGVLLFDDPGHVATGGALLALDDFLRTAESRGFTQVHLPSGQVMLVRVSGSAQSPSVSR